MNKLVKPGQVGEAVFDAIDLKIDRVGEKIILPGDPREMTYDEGIKALARARDAENMIYDINEVIPVHFFDGLVALARALKDKYGYAEATKGQVQTMFGPMKVPPQLVNVRTGPGPKDIVQVPMGGYKFPHVEGEIFVGGKVVKGIPMVNLTGKVKAKERNVVMDIVNRAVEWSKNNSIYRGRSVVLERDQNSNNIDYENPLEFFDPAAGAEMPMFNEDTERLLTTTVLAPISKSDLCRKAKIPLKRGILLEGPFGCGKTLVSKAIARTCNESGWTFILVTRSSALKHALTFAKMYQPAVVFAEDIDRAADNRGESVNDLINQIDGILGKGDEIMTVLTTNYVERIEKAFLRPGRLDTVISIRPPNAATVERLLRQYTGKLLDPKADLKEAAEKLKGSIPAVIREVAERSKLSMIVSGRDKINGDDVSVMADDMRNHLEIMDRAAHGTKPEDTMGKVFRETVGKVLEYEFGLKRKKDADAADEDAGK